jgi:hypothetical protein
MQFLKNLSSNAARAWAYVRSFWTNLGPIAKDFITLFLAFALLFMMVASATAQTAPNITSTFQTGHTGFWYEPLNSGSGMTIVVDEDGVLGVAVYTFSPTTVPQMLPGLQSGDPIEAANHLFLVGGAETSIGQYAVTIPLNMAANGEGFMGPADSVFEFGELTLEVVTCNSIQYEISVWSGFPSATGGVVQTVASGTLQKLTGQVGECALDCVSPSFGPFPAQCPARN